MLEKVHEEQVDAQQSRIFVKTAFDPRHIKRIQQMEALFAFSFNQTQAAVIAPIIEHLETIDALIAATAVSWPIEQMNKLDVAILRLGVYELLYTHTKEDIIIDEAVELGKGYGSDQSPKFINAVLGAIAKTHERSTTE